MFLSACAEPLPNSGPGRVTPLPQQPVAELGEIWNATHEAHAEEIVSTVKQLLAERSEKDTLIRRDAHPKHHGCVRATFSVDSRALDPELRVGIFSPGAQSKHDAWIRFSNGSPDGGRGKDFEGDIRGMAVKLMNVKGTTAGGTESGSHDLVMLTSKEFIAADADDYLSLHRALTGSSLSLAWHFATHPRDSLIIFKGRARAANPLQLEYFSSVPYKLGARSMKFKARPCASSPMEDSVPKDDPGADYLKERLVGTLKAKSACYQLLVQPNRDPDANPVEKANLAWDERKSPYVTVATIYIPQQEGIDSMEQRSFCENLSFDPWRTYPETRPVGQINRVRMMAYPEISRMRHDINKVPAIEPVSHENCGGKADLCREPKR